MGANNERISAMRVLAVLTRLTILIKIMPAKTLMIVHISADNEHAKSFGLDQQWPTAESQTEQRQDRVAAGRLGFGTETGTSVTVSSNQLHQLHFNE